MATIQEDRAYIVEQYNYLYGRDPRPDEIEQQLPFLQGGMSRADYTRVNERYFPEEAVQRIYRQQTGKDADPAHLAHYVALLQRGDINRAQILAEVAGSSEALLREPQPTGPTPEQEDARDYLREVLNRYDLGSLGDWAWDEIQKGNTPTRVLQDLREQAEYKQRFVGMEKRKANGLPAIDEASYIAYERSARQLMQASGFPPGFFDQPDDFADLIGKDISYDELQQRVTQGFLDASQAPVEFRSELQRLYGNDVSEGALASYFLDPDRALPLIQRQWNAAKNSGAAVRTGYGALSANEAERLAALGIDAQQAQQGFGQLVDSKELFGNLPGEDDFNVSRDEQQGAIFGGDANARKKIETNAARRKSASSGAQAFGLGNQGIGALATESR